MQNPQLLLHARRTQYRTRMHARRGRDDDSLRSGHLEHEVGVVGDCYRID